MSTNPFEDTGRPCRVLVNGEGQYSLWPSFAEVPGGWTVAHGETDRESALRFVEENWTDLRPRGMVAAVES